MYIMEAALQVSKWGNSLAVRLPKALVDQLDLKPGDELRVVEASSRQIAVEKVDKRAEFLKAMEQFRWPVPEGYTFDRDEANER
jgi:antitoxin MazE